MNRFARRFFFLGLCTAALKVLAPTVRAQNADGRIIGKRDGPGRGRGARSDGNDHEHRNPDFAEVVTDNEGYYQVLSLPIGTYGGVIEKAGFQKAVFDRQALQINQSLRVDAKLSLGATLQAVEVKEQVGRGDREQHDRETVTRAALR